LRNSVVPHRIIWSWYTPSDFCF